MSHLESRFTSHATFRAPAHQTERADNDQYQELEQAVLKDFHLPVKVLSQVTSGYQSRVYLASCGQEQFYIKINPHPTALLIEYLGLNVLTQHQIPVPQPLAYNGDPQTIGSPTLLLKEATGVALEHSPLTRDQLRHVYWQMGQLLHTFHQIKINQFGLLVPTEQELKGTSPTWKNYWLSPSNLDWIELPYLVEANVITTSQLRLLEKVHLELAELEMSQSSLLHQDLHQKHVFLTGSTITSIIDLGRLMAGDPRYDVAMSLLFQPSEAQLAFKQGYGSLADDPVVKKYMVTIAAGKVAWSFKFRFQERFQTAVNTFRDIFFGQPE